MARIKMCLFPRAAESFIMLIIHWPESGGLLRESGGNYVKKVVQHVCKRFRAFASFFRCLVARIVHDETCFE